MTSPLPLRLLAMTLVCSTALAAPLASDTKDAPAPPAVDAAHTPPADATVEQLEKLKALTDGGGGTQHHGVPDTEPPAAPVAPRDPHDTTSPPETTTKVFHGAGRLIQAGLGSNVPVSHTAVRRSFNAQLAKETENNMDHYAAYSGVQYSPLDMAEYVLWTGDEGAVTSAIEQSLRAGMMSKEEAIAFLQEIKLSLEYLRAHYAPQQQRQHAPAAEDAQRLLADHTYQRGSSTAAAGVAGFPFGGSPDIIHSISSGSWQLSNALAPLIDLPVSSDLAPSKRLYDPMLRDNNVMGSTDYDRDGSSSMVTEDEYEEMMDRLRAADSLYTQRALEETIYQLSKMMFSQPRWHEPAAARAATRRFMGYLEGEGARGQLSRNIQRKVLDIMVAALTDTVGEHPELMQPRDNYYRPDQANRVMHQLMESPAQGGGVALGGGVAEGGVARAVLAAYKDELLKGLPQRKRNYY